MSRIAHRIAQKWLQAAVTGPDQCPTCRGTGFVNLGDCPDCGGTGKIKPAPSKRFGRDEWGCYSLWPDGETERILRVRMTPVDNETWELETLNPPAWGPDLTPDLIEKWTIPADPNGDPDFDAAIKDNLVNDTMSAFADYVTTHFSSGDHMNAGGKATPYELFQEYGLDPKYSRM